MSKAPRSLQVRPDNVERVKAAYQRSSYSTQQALADELELNLDTVSRYLNGKPVARLNFFELSETLGLIVEDIALLVQDVEVEQTLETLTVATFEEPEEQVIDAECEEVHDSDATETDPENDPRTNNHQGQVTVTVVGQNNQVEKVFGEMTVHGNVTM